MFKKLVSILSLLCGVLSAGATVQYMTVEQQSGEKYSFLLKDNPVITYEDGNLVVNGSASTSYAISSVKNYHFTEDDVTSVTCLSADLLRIVSIDDATIEVQNAPINAKVMLLRIGGSVMSTFTTDVSGVARVSLPSQQGVYVLTVNNQSFKIIRK